MPAISIKLDGPEDFEPIPEGATVHHVTEAFEIAFLSDGMTSGKPSVMFRIALPDGSVALVETSFALFEMAYKAMLGRIAFLAEKKAGSL